MKVDVKKYHKDIGIPADIATPRPGHTLVYSKHAENEAAKDYIVDKLPLTVPEGYTLVEVKAFGHLPLSWVIRIKATDTKDLVLAMNSHYYVSTVWTNDVDDDHATLNREQYDIPS